MPFGIFIIMKHKHPLFTADELGTRVNEYFNSVISQNQNEKKPAKTTTAATTRAKPKKPDEQVESPTITGLAYFLGFSSLPAFDDYARNGKHAQILKRARLRIEAEYERKLHLHSSGGAIFALKSLGWNDKADDKAIDDAVLKPLKIRIIETGPPPASIEKEVIL